MQNPQTSIEIIENQIANTKNDISLINKEIIEKQSFLDKFTPIMKELRILAQNQNTYSTPICYDCSLSEKSVTYNPEDVKKMKKIGENYLRRSHQTDELMMEDTKKRKNRLKKDFEEFEEFKI